MNKKSYRCIIPKLFLVIAIITGWGYRKESKAQFWNPLPSLGGGDVYDLVPVKEQIWAATNRGIYFKATPQDKWILQTDNPIMRQNIYQLTATPNGTILAVTQDGIFRYQNRNWTNITYNLPTKSIKKILYLEKVGALVLTWNLGIFSLPENASKWEPVIISEELGAEPTFFSHIYKDSLNRIIVVERNCLYISEDSAKSWKKNVLRLDENGETPTIHCLGSRKGGGLVLGTSEGVWESTEPGLSNWQKLGKLVLTPGDILTCVGYIPQLKIYYAGSSYGQIFQLFAPYENLEWQIWLSMPFSNPITCGLITPYNQIWFGTEGNGTWAWDFSSNTWQSQSQGLMNASITAIGATTNAYFAKLSGSGVFVSWDRGESWYPSSLPNQQVQCWLTHQDTIWAGVLGNGGIWRSFDNGKTWQKFQQWDKNQIGVRQIFRTSSGELYALTFASVLWCSKDKGATWLPLHMQEIQDKNLVCFTVNKSGEIIVGCQKNGVYKYNETRNQWQPLGQALTSLSVQTLLSTKDGRLFAGTPVGVFLYESSKQDWVRLFSLPGLVTTLLQTAEDSIWVATLGAGIWLNTLTDQWQAINEGLNSLKVNSLYLTSQNEILAATYEGGLYRSKAVIKNTHIQPKYLDSTTLKVYPNPTSNFIYITSAYPLPPNCLAELVSINGNIEYSTLFSTPPINLSPLTFTLHLPSHLSAGLYYLQLKDNNPFNQHVLFRYPLIIQK